MSYNTGINQRVKEQEFFNNTTAQDQSVSETNGSLIANLTYVKNYFASAITNFLPVNNPNFTGSLTSSSGGNITLSNPFSFLSVPVLTVPTINGVSTFFSQPRISYSGQGVFPVEVRQVGEIKISVSSVAPVNYLICHGQAISTTTYSSLFSVIGYYYGGSGTLFNLPNFQNAFPLGGNGSGVPSNLAQSNYQSGAGQSGATNNYVYQSKWGGGGTELTPSMILEYVPPHSHSVIDGGHDHTITMNISAPSTITPVGVQQYLYSDEGSLYYTNPAYTNIGINSYGDNIQSIDPISNLSGVNITPPFVAVNYFICYQ